ncbi:MAG TPA: beta-ketoacyl synthase N-terminal-like domain-containing protein, partial [Gemmataceae bacterium]|nr:beta-ketoacyl synthase N-terminal-like domain-containing protein [Gemmataceae bacterium]
MSQQTAVWITGVGAATPLGHSYPAIADGLLAGRSGVARVTRFDVAEHPSQIAGQMDGVPCPPGWEADEFRRRPPLEQLVLWCCAQALRDAGW